MKRLTITLEESDGSHKTKSDTSFDLDLTTLYDSGKRPEFLEAIVNDLEDEVALDLKELKELAESNKSITITLTTKLDNGWSNVVFRDIAKTDYRDITELTPPGKFLEGVIKDLEVELAHASKPVELTSQPEQQKAETMTKEATEETVEQKIQEKKLKAPRLTPADIDAKIVNITYTNLPSKKVVVCEITLKNGYTVRGDSACVSPENFDQEIGNGIALKNARDKIWQLEGYLLQERYPVTQVEEFRPAPQIRVIQEASDLREHVEKLVKFIKHNPENMLDSDRLLLLDQAEDMAKYLSILEQRIAKF